MTKRQAEELLAATEANHRLATLSDDPYTQGYRDAYGHMLALLKVVVREYPDDAAKPLMALHNHR